MSGWEGIAGSLRLDASELDHLSPPFDIVCYGPSECRGRTPEHNAAQFADPRDDSRIGEAGSHLLIELTDNLGGRIPGRPEPEPAGAFVTGQEVSHRWYVRQHVQTSR